MPDYAYKRCSGCEGLGIVAGIVCPACDGWGGFWIVLGPGLKVRVVPGDADHRPEEPP